MLLSICWFSLFALISSLVSPELPLDAQSQPSSKLVTKQTVWLSGTVRDIQGIPVQGAQVMLLGTYDGGIRMIETTAQDTTDAEGHYRITGAGGLQNFSAAVVAVAKGHPPAWAWPSFPELNTTNSQSGESIPALSQDFVVPSISGRLNVSVFRHGEPASGVTVAVYLQNANLRDIWARPSSSASVIYDAVYPKAKTNDAGIASFDYLLPGSYQIVAAATEASVRSRLVGLAGLEGEANESDGISVRAGETATYSMNIWKQTNRAVMRALSVDGSPLAQNTAMSFGPVDSIQWKTTPQFDAAGFADVPVDHPGLWRLDVIARNSTDNSDPIEPYFRASGHVAVSPNLKDTEPVTSTARWVDAGSVRIVMVNQNREPLRVKVMVGDAWGQHKSIAVTDAHGEVVFHGLRDGHKYFVTLLSSAQTDVRMVNGGKFLVRPAGSGPFPVEPEFWLLRSNFQWSDIPALRPEPGIMERTFIARTEKQTTLMMPVVPLTYVYGDLLAPAGQPKQWGMQIDFSAQRRGASLRVWQQPWRYLAGPFPPGEAFLDFGTGPNGTPHYGEPRVKLLITGHDGCCLRFDVDTTKFVKLPEEPAEPNNGNDAVMLGMNGITAHSGGSAQLAGTVLGADGLTPALGAQVFYFPAHQERPTLLAMADGLGHLQARGLWRTGTNASVHDAPERGTVVAFLPGNCGATMQTAPLASGQPFRLILPARNELSGSITIGGKAPSALPGVLHVIAAYQGRKFLQPYLSLETSADKDGHFSFSGLTPGDYRIQASLDNLWLSPAVTLHVDSAKSRPLHLAIPSPGAPLYLKLVDASHKPMPGGTVSIERDGPMASLWPATWAADGKGWIAVPTLEAGWQRIRVPGRSKPIRLKIPKLPAAPVRITVKVQQQAAKIDDKPDPDTTYAPTLP